MPGIIIVQIDAVDRIGAVTLFLIQTADTLWSQGGFTIPYNAVIF